MAADHRGLADDHAGAVVDEEIIADGGAGMDVDARELMGVFRHHPGQQRHLQFKQPVGQPEDGDGLEGRIGQKDLLVGAGGGVALVGGLDVGVQRLCDAAETVHKGAGGGLGLFRAGVAFRRALDLLRAGGRHDAGAHLREQLRRLLQLSRDEGPQGLGPHQRGGINIGVHGAAQKPDQLLHLAFHAIAAEAALSGGQRGNIHQPPRGVARRGVQPLLDHGGSPLFLDGITTEQSRRRPPAFGKNRAYSTETI